MPHPVDCLIHARLFFDVGVGTRHIGFGLVIIVIADEIFDGVLRKEVLELAVKLRRSEEHTSELQSLLRISYAVFCLKKKKQTTRTYDEYHILKKKPNIIIKQ